MKIPYRYLRFLKHTPIRGGTQLDLIEMSTVELLVFTMLSRVVNISIVRFSKNWSNRVRTGFTSLAAPIARIYTQCQVSERSLVFLCSVSSSSLLTLLQIFVNSRDWRLKQYRKQYPFYQNKYVARCSVQFSAQLAHIFALNCKGIARIPELCEEDHSLPLPLLRLSSS